MKHPKDLTCVFTGSGMETNVIIEILKDNDIPVVPHSKFQQGLHAGFINGLPGDVSLMIEREDMEKAQALIQEYQASIQ